MTASAHEFKLVPGFACDIQVNDSNGAPWDFDIREQRNQCIRDVLQQRPNFVVGNPMCTAFSILQGLNQAKMEDTKWQAMMGKGVRHMLFAIKIHRILAKSWRVFLHEHPQSASSWRLPEMVSLMEDLKITKTATHMCRFGMNKDQDWSRSQLAS